MKIRAYMRIAKAGGGKFKIHASAKPDSTPLYKLVGYRGSKKALPTVAFALDFEVPDAQFEQATRLLGEVQVRDYNTRILTEVAEPL